MDLSKYLYAPAYNPNTPEYVKSGRDMIQSNRDQNYLHGPGGVENWLGQRDGWINRNTFNRNAWIAGGKDAASFVADEFTMRAPSRTITDYTDAGIPNWRDDTAENCPALAALFPKPALPEYAPPPPSPIGPTSQPPGSIQKDTQQAVQDAIVLGALKDLQVKVDAICAQFNVKF